MHPWGNKSPPAQLWRLPPQSTLVTSDPRATSRAQLYIKGEDCGGPKTEAVESTAQANIPIQVCGADLTPGMVSITGEKGLNLLWAF